ncbi:MAG: S8 family serine peptidase [Myxococcota bacterium]
MPPRSPAGSGLLSRLSFGASLWLTLVLVLGLVGFGGLVGCAPMNAPDQRGDPAVRRPLQLEEHQIVVGIDLLTPALRQALAQKLARYFEIEIAGAFPLDSIDLHCVVYRVPGHLDVEEIMAGIRRQPGVRLVQHNQRFVSLGAPGQHDPYAAMQYGPERVGAKAAHQWVSGDGIRIAVIDTGVDFEHPDFASGQLQIENFVDGGRPSFASDRHGTAVAGIIGAQPENGEGIYGIAPGADLLASKACWHPAADSDAAVCSSWTIARAIDHALTRRTRVINLSLGGPPDELIEKLLREADANNIVVVAAAGESAEAIRFPASLEFVIAVYASDPEGDVPASPRALSGRAIAAPGIQILTTAPGARYLPRSGSSLATAHVAGAIALLLEYAPERSPAELALLVAGGAEERAGTDAGGMQRSLPHLDVCASLHRASGGSLCKPPEAASDPAPTN